MSADQELDAFLKAHPHCKIVEATVLYRTPNVPGSEGEIISYHVPKEYPKGYIPFEADEQVEFVSWLEVDHPDVAFYAVPNGGKRNKKTAADLKRQGVKAGVPDLIICEPRGQYHGLYIEMKRTVGGDLSDKQREWMDKLGARGYCCMVAEGADEAKKKFLAYMSLGPFKAGKGK